MSEHTGGTVTYHRAEYDPDGEWTWRVWFTQGGGYLAFTAEQGEAMGLTPQEPAPLVVTCNGHSIELSDLDADVFQRTWAERATYDIAYDRACDKLAGLLRDACQDPQPASDEPTYFPDEGFNLVKRNVRTVTANVVQPAPATSDTLDFDALPIGTVLALGPHALRVKVTDDQWAYIDRDDLMSTASLSRPDLYTIVYQPAALSPGECLRGLLAGRDDAEEMLAEMSTWTRGRGWSVLSRWVAVGADAAHGGGE